MDVPKRLPILGQAYTVSLRDDMVVSESSYGETLYQKMTIEIANDPSVLTTTKLRTLLHEIAHAWMYENGLAEILPDGADELIAQSFQSLILGIFEVKFHPDLMKGGKCEI